MKGENHMNNNKKPSRKHDWTPQELQLIALCIQQAWEDNIEDSED